MSAEGTECEMQRGQGCYEVAEPRLGILPGTRVNTASLTNPITGSYAKQLTYSVTARVMYVDLNLLIYRIVLTVSQSAKNCTCPKVMISSHHAHGGWVK